MEEKRPSGIPWQRITASDAGVLPPKASGHSVTLVDGQLYVFGGCGVEKRQPGEALPQPSSSHCVDSTALGLGVGNRLMLGACDFVGRGVVGSLVGDGTGAALGAVENVGAGRVG